MFLRRGFRGEPLTFPNREANPDGDVPQSSNDPERSVFPALSQQSAQAGTAKHRRRPFLFIPDRNKKHVLYYESSIEKAIQLV